MQIIVLCITDSISSTVIFSLSGLLKSTILKLSGTAFRLELVAVVLIVFVSLCYFNPNRTSASSPQAAVSIQVSIPSQQFVRVISPSTSNITVLSVNGGQYDLSLTMLPGLNQLQFIPDNTSVYSLLVNVSASTANFAYVMKQNGSFGSEVKNATGTGNILLNLTVTTSPAAPQGNSWDPLFGITGLHAGDISLSFPALMVIIFAFGALFLVLGIKFHSYVLYLGLSILSIGAIMLLGILVMFGILAVYILSFVGVSLAWRIGAKKRNK